MGQMKINSNKLSLVLFILSAILLLFFIAAISKANIGIKEQLQMEENKRLCEKESQMLADASDLLTSQVWHFVVNHKKEHLVKYWDEVNNTRNRDAALKHLKELSLSPAETRMIESAKEKSDLLAVKETWAMRLIADSIGMDTEDMPLKMASVVYTNGEEKLSAQDKEKMASDYMFGEEYAVAKEEIKGNIDSFRQLVQQRKNGDLTVVMNQIRRTFELIKVLVLLLILLFITQLLFYYFSIVRPFHFYTLALGDMEEKGFTSIVPMGARETRSFALAFNQVYSDWQRQNKQLEQERYRFRVALENTSVIVYEYEVERDIYTAYGTLELIKKGQQVERVIPAFLAEYAGNVMGEGRAEQMRQIISNAQFDPIEMQVKALPCKEEEIWVSITGTPVYAEDGSVSRLIGKITNIQSEKEKEFALEEERNRDGLTGFYKQRAGLFMIRDFMQSKTPDVICCIMILDMDDFGKLDEAEGAVFADAVLQDVADIIKENVGPEDIQVRLGGDEFLLFFKHFTKVDAVRVGGKIAEQIRQLSGRQSSNIQISASIGMCSSEVVDEYNGLYHCAESTLKYVKEHGKAKAACYLDTSRDLDIPLTQLYPESFSFNEIARSENTKDDLSSFALNLLGKSKNLNDAIYLLLSRVGSICHFDRITILEVDMEYLSCHVLHQWTGKQVCQSPRENQYIDREEMNLLKNSYDEDGLCSEYIINLPFDLESILHAAIWNYGSYAGCMCFEKEEAHSWTDKERSLLSELTKIISSFTLKAKADAVSQAKTDFLSRMSHEIRTPMNAITGMTTIAKTVLENPEKELDCLNKIEFANKHLMHLINDILDMSRIESGKVESIATPAILKELAENVEMLVRSQAEEKSLKLTIEDMNTGSRPVMIDELHLNQVLVNLLGNAIKFTDKNGEIILRMERLSSEGTEVLFRFSVKDNGIGISEEAQKRIFVAFEQAGSDTVSNYGGTGLGLAISSRLVQLMGGTLEVKSTPGEGSDFFFTLHSSYAPDTVKQVSDAGEKQADLAGKESIAFDPHGKRLLLAEDNELNLEIAEEILTAHGFTVETAVDGREAMEQFRTHDTGYYDAILMDIRMPVMDGMEATRRIRTMGKPDSRVIPIIAMTANAFDEDMKKSLENGMNGHLSKPIDVNKLFEMLAEFICARENP